MLRKNLPWKGVLARLAGKTAPRPSKRAAADDQKPGPHQPNPRPLESYLTVPVREDAAEANAVAKARERGRFLGRQDRWEELSAALREADLARETTPGGVPLGELLAYGARADAVEAAEHALTEGDEIADTLAFEGVRGLEEMRREMPDDPYLAYIVAMTHVDLAWAWRGVVQEDKLPALNQRKCIAHFDRAAALMAPICGIELGSPLIAAGQCALLAGRQDPHLRVADDFEDLIDLDPTNPRHMRMLGYHLLPRWFGSYAQLDVQARRTAVRTRDIWGNGGYTWVTFDAIAQDAGACAHVDVEFFIDGMRDILAARPDQETVNMLAAYCAITLQRPRTSEASPARKAICDCAGWIIRDHLREVHPMVWAHAERGFDNNAQVSSVFRFAERGRINALRAIAAQFQDDIRRGLHVTLTPDGPQLSAN